MSVRKEGKDIEMAQREESSIDEGEGDDIDKEEEESNDEVLDRDVDVPMFVFLWTYPPWRIHRNFVPFFLTHACLFCAFGVLLCNYGYALDCCTWIGLCGFVSCILGMSKIQTFSHIIGESEILKDELIKMKKLMAKFENENQVLKDTLVKLEEQSEALKEESTKLSRFNTELNISTIEYEAHVREFRRERLELSQTFEKIDEIVKELGVKEGDVQKRCTILKKELKKLRAHNKAIAETYNNLVDEHQNVQKTNERMANQIKKFQEMRQAFIDQRDILKNSMRGNLSGLNSMMENYEILYLQEVAHNTEFLDGQPGMTVEKFDEFIRRIPANINVSNDFLISLFEELSDDNFVCDHEAMRRIVVEIVKANTGFGRVSGGDEQQPDEKSSVVDL